MKLIVTYPFVNGERYRLIKDLSLGNQNIHIPADTILIKIPDQLNTCISFKNVQNEIINISGYDQDFLADYFGGLKFESDFQDKDDKVSFLKRIFRYH
jgi:hypothetical protein